jgi:hypothetical protein
MSFMKLRRVVIGLLAAATFALCWGGAISSFGQTGLYLGWIAAAIAARLAAVVASVLWSTIALTVLLGWHFHASERDGFFAAPAAA